MRMHNYLICLLFFLPSIIYAQDEGREYPADETITVTARHPGPVPHLLDSPGNESRDGPDNRQKEEDPPPKGGGCLPEYSQLGYCSNPEPRPQVTREREREREEKAVAAELDECTESRDAAIRRCKIFEDPSTLMWMNSILNSGVGNSSKKACEAAQALNAAGLTANQAFAQKCRSVVGDCITSCTCKKDPEGTCKEALKTCEGLKGIANQSLFAAGQNVMAILGSRDCVKFYKAGERCNSQEKIKKDEYCKRQYCNRLSFDVRLADPLCKDITEDVDCSKNHNFAHPACACQRNPSNPACGGSPTPRTLTTLSPTHTTLTDGEGPFGPGDFPPPSPPTTTEPSPRQPGLGLGIEGGPNGGFGGGGLGGGGNSSGGRSSGTQGGKSSGRRASLEDKSIISGSSSGRASGSARGRSGYLSGRRYLGKTGAGGAPIDLKKYLPGSKERGLAGAVKKKMEKAGITSANGLSNWEKVKIRYMEQRRRNSFINKP